VLGTVAGFDAEVVRMTLLAVPAVQAPCRTAGPMTLNGGGGCLPVHPPMTCFLILLMGWVPSSFPFRSMMRRTSMRQGSARACKQTGSSLFGIDRQQSPPLEREPPPSQHTNGQSC
jgi:hypothetical protein